MALGAFKKETAETILAVVRYLKESGYVIERPGRGQQFIPPQAPIYVRNDSGEEIPPFACMQTNGAVDAGGQNYITVDKPVDDTGTAGRYLFNGIAPIEIGGYGIAHDGPLVRMLTDGTAIASGDLWQPTVAAWAVKPGGELFTAAGADDIDTNVMRAFVTGGGGGIGRIEFEVLSATTVSDTGSPYDGMRKLSVEVVGPSCNRASMLGDTVDVYEHDPQCLTSGELDAELVGRKGWAFEGIFQDQSATATAGDATPCHWVLDGICCP